VGGDPQVIVPLEKHYFTSAAGVGELVSPMVEEAFDRLLETHSPKPDPKPKTGVRKKSQKATSDA
jgi:hypothetical protein